MTKIFLTISLFLFSTYGFTQSKQSILGNPKTLKSVLLQNNVWGKKIFIGYSKMKKPIYAYYYNRGGTDNAMVIGGVHGSEFYGVDVVNALKDSLDKMKNQKFKWRVLVLPELFPDNVEKGRNNVFKENYGRKTCEVCNGQKDEDECEKHCVDPNRQMPSINKEYNIGDTLSCKNDKIEIENQYLLYLTQQFNPSRIASLHCKNTVKESEIGIYADPRTNYKNVALGFSQDAVLSLKMAFIVKECNGIIYGNFVDSIYNKSKVDKKFRIKAVSYLNPVYPQDPYAANKGEEQVRSYQTTNGGKVSFGTWASTEISKGNKIVKKAAITLTIELPQYSYFFDETNNSNSVRKEDLVSNTTAYVRSLKEAFLEEK